MMNWIRFRLRLKLRFRFRARRRVRGGFRAGFGLANASLPPVPGRHTPCSSADLMGTAAHAPLPALPSIAPAPACLQNATEPRISFNLAFPK